MILQRRIFIQRTPLDIPIMLFLLSQVISTIFSQDHHISIWGYYSRFNGGLLSIVAYIFLYYAFVSNFGSTKIVKRLLFVSLISGLVVALWGLPSHFGHDPTCLIFRGNLDVSCWTEDFQPRVRIFSTLGQPDWLAAYLAILLPIAIIMVIKFIKNIPLSIFYILLSALFYLDLLYSGARSGIIATWVSLIFLIISYLWIQKKQIFKLSTLNFQLSTLLLAFLFITFFVGTPISQLHKFTFQGLKTQFANNKPVANDKKTTQTPEKQVVHAGELGGTDSTKIRSIVWQGAIEIWKHNPIFGTGVETFAFAYYRFKPPAHNLTSEWNFLYNKAHNEFLNYLATTGAFGLGTYLLMIGWFMLVSFRAQARNPMGIPKQVRDDSSSHSKFSILNFALLASYLSILVTNFFGFSVVITNIYLFMIPAFVFVLMDKINQQKVFVFPKSRQQLTTNYQPLTTQWIFIVIVLIVSSYLLFVLFKFWVADKVYAYGYNLDRSGDYQQAYPHLHKAVADRGDEPVFKDELSVNDAVVAVGLINQQKDSKDDKTNTRLIASKLAQEAIEVSNLVTSSHPNNVVFWKTRVRLFYTLSQVDSRYLPLALDAIEKTAQLAPTDASISYNLGVLYGQNNDIKKAIEALNNTVNLKPDYRDAHYALGLFYHDAAIDKDGKVINSLMQKKAVEQMQYVLNNISPNDSGATEALKTWEKK